MFSRHIFPLILGLLSISTRMVVEGSSPVLLWSPERPLVDLPDVSSVDSFSASDFHDQYLSPLMHRGQENGVIFLQDKLSIDDFTKYADVYSVNSNGGAFKNVKRLMDDHYSLEVPEVDMPHVAVEKLQKNFDGVVHVLNAPFNLESLHLDGGKRFLLIVNLHPHIKSANEETTITQNDGLVGDIISHLQNKGMKYISFFTGKSGQQDSSQIEPEDETQHSGRHLLATTTEGTTQNNCTFMNVTVTGGEIYVFLCKIKVVVKEKAGDNKYNIIELNKTATVNDANESKRNNNTAEVVLAYKDVEGSDKGKYNIKIIMEVAKKQDRWQMVRNSLYLTQSSGSGGNKTDIQNGTLVNGALDTVIPIPYSFHCSKLRLYVETVYNSQFDKYTGSYVSLEGFQFQVFNISQNRFFHAQDCVGFFTSAIWMGIIPGLLLVFIFVYGTLMVLNLSVMDKFDDPKGKTITVNAGE